MNLRSCTTILFAVLVCLIHSGCIKTAIDPSEKSITASLTAKAVTANGKSLASNYITAQYNLPIRVDTNFAWGVNGHPLVQVSYYTGDVNTQMSLLKELQLKYYRFDMNCDSNGQFNTAYNNNLFTAAAANNITLIPVIIAPKFPKDIPLADAEREGRTMAAGFIQSYGSHFHYYELPNEWDNQCQLPTSTDGNVLANYDPNLTAIACAYYKGMIQAIKSADPTAKTIISSGDHYAWFTLLEQGGVNFDILGYHYYATDLPSRLTSLQAFSDKEIWITEINANGYFAQPTVQASAIEQDIQDLDLKSYIKGFFVYELLDESNISGTEGQYGMLQWTNPVDFTSPLTKKPIFETYKYKIEEQKNGFQDFIYSLYLYCNLRVPDPGGLQYWTAQAASSRDIPGIVNQILPAESFGIFVNQCYQQLYGRDADPTGLQYWTNQLVSGTTRESLLQIFCSSDEFWGLSGSTNAGFINRLYLKLLNRAPYNSELTNWETELANGTSRSSMTGALLLTTEYLTIFIRAQYNQLLRRNGNVESGSTTWAIGLMQGGMSQLDFIKTLLDSYEFWQRGIQEGYQRNDPPFLF